MTDLMPSPVVLVAFVGASLVMLIVPGPSVVYVVTRTLDQGRRAGLYSMLGLETGAAVHVLAATIGLANLVTASETAFTALKMAGAAYLAWLAFREFRTLQPTAAGTGDRGRTARSGPLRLYLDGFLVDLLNPKTAVFFLAFLPQFVDPSRSPAPQFATLGLIFVGLAAVVDAGYALISGRISRRIRASARVQRHIQRVTGSLYVILAGAAVLA